VIVARTEFLQKHGDLVEKWVKAHGEVSQRINQNRQAVVPVLESEIKRLTGRGLAPAIIGESLTRIDFTSDPYPQTLQVQADRAFALGFLGRTKPDLTGLVQTPPATATTATTTTSGAREASATPGTK
jgi:NitT/TauT family transport system substrate-binding protein